ncbi:MAG TPA: alkaline phosphatase family protein [Acidimicrobiales bacterium]|nr:alkaline phosphatase family protein [Acidimicrobiales bacterium]
MHRLLSRLALPVALAAMVLVPSTARASTTEHVPALKHVFVIVLENEDFATSWGPDSPATYLNSLVRRGAFADRYYGVSHLSADNYIAMTSGQPPTPVFQSDCQNWAMCYGSEKARVDGGRSIVDQLEEKGLTWGAYMESMGTPCKHPALTDLQDPNSVGYATRHNPFVYYPPVVDDQKRCDDHVVDYSALPPLLRSHTRDAVPNFVFITPDTCDDGHDAPCKGDKAGQPGGLVSADQWLQANVPLILDSAAYKDGGALFITFDEASNSDTSGCCASGVSGIGTDGGGRVGLLMLSSLARVGHATDSFYDHHSLLRTIEDAFGITEHLNNAASPKEHSMSDLFTPSRRAT